MQRCVSISQMQAFDKATIEKVGSTNLMLKAAKAVFDEIKNLANKNIYIISGGGNNGGDGIALFMLLNEAGYTPKLFLTSSRLSLDSQYFYDKVKNNKNIFDINSCDYKADVIVDCILGTGFQGDVKDSIKDVIEKINNSKAYVVSVDIPSGLNGNNGIAKCSVKANKTVTIQFAKYGLFLNDGKDYVGELVVKDIGIEAIEKCVQIIEEKDIIFNRRLNNVNKSTFGKSTIIGGCINFPGAIKIANMGVLALRVGAGLNAIAVPYTLKDAMITSVVESTITYLKDNNGYLVFDKEGLDKIIATSNAIAVGMGMGPNKDENKKIIKYLIENFTGPIIIDADGLNAFEGDIKYLFDKSNVIVTPHPKEFERISGMSIRQILDDPISAVKSVVVKNGATILLKGTSTIIAKDDDMYLVVNGTPALAKGGSGDTLSGVILGLLAQGRDNIDAAYTGAYLCAKAATDLEKDYSAYGVLASDVARLIKNFILNA